MPPASVATTARPRANASITTRPSPSGHEGSTSTVASSSAADTAGRIEPLRWCSTRSGEVARVVGRQRPAASRGRRSRAARPARARRRAARPRRGPRCSCTARASRRRRRPAGRAAASTGRSVKAERSLKAVKTASAGTPRTCSTSSRGERGDGARRVRAAHGRLRERRRRAARQARARRAVAARERAPVAVHLDDHRRPAAGRATRPRSAAAPRTGSDGEDRVRAEVPDAAGGRGRASGGRRADRRAAAGGTAASSRKRSSLSGAALGRRSDDAVVELRLDRVPLLREPLRQRQLVAHAADEEDARAGVAHRAASAEQCLEPAVDRLARDRLDGRLRACCEPFSEAGLLEHAPHRGRELDRAGPAARAGR